LGNPEGCRPRGRLLPPEDLFVRLLDSCPDRRVEVILGANPPRDQPRRAPPEHGLEFADDTARKHVHQEQIGGFEPGSPILADRQVIDARLASPVGKAVGTNQQTAAQAGQDRQAAKNVAVAAAAGIIDQAHGSPRPGAAFGAARAGNQPPGACPSRTRSTECRPFRHVPSTSASKDSDFVSSLEAETSNAL
jgi:hypothetical protein